MCVCRRRIWIHRCGAVCCSVLQCAAMWCRLLQCDAVMFMKDRARESVRVRVWAATFGYASVVQCDAVCCSVMPCGTVWCSVSKCVAVCRSVLQRVAMCCSVLKCVAVYLSDSDGRQLREIECVAAMLQCTELCSSVPNSFAQCCSCVVARCSAPLRQRVATVARN